MLIPLLSSAMALAMPHPDAVRPEGHIYQVPWWNRTPPIQLFRPEASNAPSSQPYNLGEFDPIEGVLLTTWYAEWTPTWTGMIRAIANRGIPIYLCESPVPSGQARRAIEDSGVNLEDINFLDCNVDSVWMRDYGPFFTMDEDASGQIGDAAYYEYATKDDAFPELLAGIWDEPLFQVPLSMEGGNFYADGLGTCVSTSTVYEWYNVSEDEATEVYRDTLGCDRTLWLEPLEGEGTGHVDMYFTYVDTENVIVGSYNPNYDPSNAALLDRQAETLSDAGYTVHRVPMLPYDDTDGDGWEDFRTVINGFFINTEDSKAFLMPSYYEQWSDETAAARAAIVAAMPGVEIVDVPADDLITYGGALHCVVKTLPVPKWPDPCNDPYDFNDADCSEDGIADDEDLKAGCGCTSAPSQAPWWAMVFPLAIGLRRRR